MKQSKLLFLMLIYISSSIAYENPFAYFDNNVGLSYQYTNIQDTADLSMLGLNAGLLFKNNLWLNAGASGLLTYNLSNNNRGLNELSQNKSGSRISLRGGYGFNYDNYNLIPYLGFAYNNLLIAYNQDSTQQFIFENPSYNIGTGVLTEYILVPQTLKVAFDTGLTYSIHKSVLPNTTDTLSHVNYSNYLFNISPSLQYTFFKNMTLSLYYSLSGTFAQSGNPSNVYYSSINVNSANVINTDSLNNTLGISLGVLF